MIEDLAEYLVNKLNLELGKNLFIGFWPDSPSNATGIFEYQGQSPCQELGTGRIVEERLAFQFKFRGNRYREVSSRSNEAFQALCSEECAFEVHPLQSPFSLGWSGDTCEFAFNARVIQ